MTEEENSNDIITLFQRCKTTDDDIKDLDNDKIFKNIMSQFKKVFPKSTQKVGVEVSQDDLQNTAGSSKLQEVLSKCGAKKTHDDKAGLSHTDGVFRLSFA